MHLHDIYLKMIVAERVGYEEIYCHVALFVNQISFLPSSS